MRPFSQDIVEFIRHKFQPAEVPKVLEILHRNADVLSTPRVQRSVLFLSDGSLTMLKHYAATAALDVREILTRAEYVVGVSALPLPVRSMERPFQSSIGSNHGKLPEAKTTAEGAGDGRPPQLSEHGDSGLHSWLLGERFKLGDAEYSVSGEQSSSVCVRCLRRAGNVVSIVHLPLTFVMEQLSEHIELHSNEPAAF